MKMNNNILNAIKNTFYNGGDIMKIKISKNGNKIKINIIRTNCRIKYDYKSFLKYYFNDYFNYVCNKYREIHRQIYNNFEYLYDIYCDNIESNILQDDIKTVIAYYNKYGDIDFNKTKFIK